MGVGGGKSDRIRGCFLSLLLDTRRCLAWLPGGTCDITFICTVSTSILFFPPLSFLPCLAERKRRWGGGRKKVTLALKPAIVFPPGRPASQAAQSVRDSERRREGETVAMVTSREMRAHLFICWPRERARRGPLLSRCARVRVCVYTGGVFFCRRADVCVRAGACAWMRLSALAQNTPGLINRTFNGFLCKQTCTNTRTCLIELQLTCSAVLSQ